MIRRRKTVLLLVVLFGCSCASQGVPQAALEEPEFKSLLRDAAKLAIEEKGPPF